MLVKKNYKDKEWLTQKHITEGLSLSEIATLENCTRQRIIYWARKLGVSVNKKNDNVLKGGDGRVSCICQFCGHKKYMVAVKPSVKEVLDWLKTFQCPICHKKRKLKI